MCLLFINFVISVQAVILPVIGIMRCDMMEINYQLNDDNSTEYVTRVGLFRHSDTIEEGTDICLPYSQGEKYNMDLSFASSRVFAIIATILSVAGMILFWLTCCGAGVMYSPTFFRYLGIICGSCCVFRGLSFLVFNSSVCKGHKAPDWIIAQDETLSAVDVETSCMLGYGSVNPIYLCFLWMLAAAFFLRMAYSKTIREVNEVLEALFVIQNRLEQDGVEFSVTDFIRFLQHRQAISELLESENRLEREELEVVAAHLSDEEGKLAAPAA